MLDTGYSMLDKMGSGARYNELIVLIKLIGLIAKGSVSQIGRNPLT